MAKLSNGFSGPTTRKLSDFSREVESRLGGRTKHLDTFTDDFDPPGSGEAFPGGNFGKRQAPYGQPHTDTRPVARREFWDKRMHSAGDTRDQEKMDWLDDMVYQIDAPIKNPYDQFPGTMDMEDHRQDATLKPYHTDPMRLKMDTNVGPDGFNKAVETKMKRLVSGTGDANNPDQHDQRTQQNPEGPSDSDIRDERMMLHRMENVDESLWKKAKHASQQAFGKIKWPFVMWWYKEHGGQ